MARRRTLEEEDWDEGEDGDDSEDTVPCPYCRREILEDSPQCPHCGNYISEEDSPPTRNKPLWVIILACLLLVAFLWWVIGR